MTGTVRVGIQADDLTGACDTGAVFAARGLETLVLLADAPGPTPPAPVVVLDTESRGLPAAEARARARDAACRLAASGPAVLYKKVDSTLRGALAAEVAGVLAGAGLSSVILAPAFPGQRRTVVDGALWIDGRPADETPVARDPRFPATGASVLALAGVEGPHPVGLVPLATVRRGPEAVAARLGRGLAVLVCDAETDADLSVLALVPGGRQLLAGSAGFATAIARRMGGDPTPATSLRRPLLVVAGSAHPATRIQLERLEGRGVGSSRLGFGADAREVQAPDGPDWILTTAAEPTDISPAEREAMAARLAAAARRLVADETRGSTSRYGTLLLTGGETAVAVCRALGATGIALGGELAPGLPVGRLRDGPVAGLAVVTKGGGFGDPETLVRVRETLT